jgi:hypothetical protein
VNDGAMGYGHRNLISSVINLKEFQNSLGIFTLNQKLKALATERKRK